MAERRRGKKKQQEITEKPTKVETAVAKHLRFNVPTKEGKLVGMPVQYFIAAEAVDCLMESKWSSSKNKTDPLFSNRASCLDFCHTLLLKGMFHRAGKVERRKDKDRDKKKKKLKDEAEAEKKTKKSKDEAGTEEGSKREEEKGKKEKKSKRRKDEETKDESEEDKKKDGDNDDKKDEDKKKKKKEKKIRLEMVDHQVFMDGEEIYVWIYDPVPFKTFIIGLFLVLGAIGVCLFPLWPPEVRLGVYYLSLTVASLIGALLSLCIVRVILFALIWVLTFGRHHFWFLPNLNEDVGFMDSFRPLYHYEYHGGESESKTEEEEGGDNKTDTAERENGADKNADNDADKKTDNEGEQGEDTGTGSELDNDNGYEIVDRADLPEGEGEEIGMEESKKTK